MKKYGLFTSFILLSLVGIDVSQIPLVVEELQKQEVPSETKQTQFKTTSRTPESNLIRYQGTWFTIDYPNTFTATPTGPTELYNGIEMVKTDEARFLSKDGSVEFYVYSPLWGGKPDYTFIKDSEELIDQKEVATPGAGFEKSLTEWVTVKAKDNSYYRSYVHTRKQIDTGSEYTYTFGIKYSDRDSYNTYKDAYVAFKKSLVQYSD